MHKTCGKPRLIDDEADEAIRQFCLGNKLTSLKQLSCCIDEKFEKSLSRKRKSTTRESDGTVKMARMSKKRFMNKYKDLVVSWDGDEAVKLKRGFVSECTETVML